MDNILWHIHIHGPAHVACLVAVIIAIRLVICVRLSSELLVIVARGAVVYLVCGSSVW